MNIRKYLAMGAILFLAILLIACEQIPIEIILDDTPITLKEGETYDLDIETTDIEGWVFEIVSPDILSIDSSGTILFIQTAAETLEEHSFFTGLDGGEGGVGEDHD